MPRCVGRDGYGFSTGGGTVCLHLQLGLIAAYPLAEPGSVQLMHAMQMHPTHLCPLTLTQLLRFPSLILMLRRR